MLCRPERWLRNSSDHASLGSKAKIRALSAHVQRLSPEEYLKLERAAEFRSEYFNGRMYAMAGASHRQGVVIANLVAALHH